MVREAKLTVEQLEHFPNDGKRREVIGGQLYVSTALSIHHQRIVQRLVVATDRYLQNNPVGEILAGIGVVFSPRDGVIPDVVFVSEERSYMLEHKRLHDAPDWAIEVLSPGNAEYDLETKRELYQQQGVRLYWIVDPERREILVFEGDSEEPTIYRKNAKVEVSLLPGLVFDVAELTKKQYR